MIPIAPVGGHCKQTGQRQEVHRLEEGLRLDLRQQAILCFRVQICEALFDAVCGHLTIQVSKTGKHRTACFRHESTEGFIHEPHDTGLPGTGCVGRGNDPFRHCREVGGIRRIEHGE